MPLPTFDCEDEEDPAPAMPVVVTCLAQLHRQKIEDVQDPWSFYACVAREVPKAERRTNPAAVKALKAEWDKLRSAGEKGCWHESAVREYDELLAEIKAQKRKVHFGNVMELRGEELRHSRPGKDEGPLRFPRGHGQG